MPLPIWGLIVGAVIGFMASPNPVVALMSGGMLALIGWAITGFSMGGEAVPEKRINYHETNNNNDGSEHLDTFDPEVQEL